MVMGTVVRQPALRTTATGMVVGGFSVMTTRSWDSASSSQKYEKTYHRIVCWDGLATFCHQALSEQMRVYVEGRLSTRKYIDKEGQEKMITEIVASEVIPLSEQKVEAMAAMDVLEAMS